MSDKSILHPRHPHFIIIEMMEQLKPPIVAWRRDGNSWCPVFECELVHKAKCCGSFVCPKCRHKNTHGAVDENESHRASHCHKDCWPHGYFVRTKKVETPAA
jgi:hypothetical protein